MQGLASLPHWRRQSFEARLEPPKDAVRVYLRLDFSDFQGRFLLDTFELCPIFEPLQSVPQFGFAELSDLVRAAAEGGELERTAELASELQGRLEKWRGDAAQLPDDDAARMNVEIDVVAESLRVCRADLK